MKETSVIFIPQSGAIRTSAGKNKSSWTRCWRYLGSPPLRPPNSLGIHLSSSRDHCAYSGRLRRRTRSSPSYQPPTYVRTYSYYIITRYTYLRTYIHTYLHMNTRRCKTSNVNKVGHTSAHTTTWPLLPLMLNRILNLLLPSIAWYLIYECTHLK